MTRSNKKVKVAVIGAGSWGHQHARAFSCREDAYLCSITGRTPERTRRRAEEFHVPWYVDIGEMLEREKPDLISICMPGLYTFEPTLQVIRAGVPLLVEKPLAYDMDDAETLIREAKARKLFFAIDFNQRYSIPALRAKADMERLGDVVFALWRFGHGSEPKLSHPFTTLIEAQCHGLDMLEHLCGPIVSVMAEMTDMTGKESFSTFTLSLRFAGGGVGSLIGTFDASENYCNSQYVEVCGTRGRVLFEDNIRSYRFQLADSPTAEVWNPRFFADDERSFGCNLDRHLDALIPALKAGEAPPVPAERGLRALKLAYAAIESFRTGMRISCAP